MKNHPDATPPHTGRAPVAAFVTPALAFGATLIARKMMARTYESVTGKSAPSSEDRTASLGTVLAWAAVSAATAAVIEVAVYRIAARVFDE